MSKIIFQQMKRGTCAIPQVHVILTGLSISKIILIIIFKVKRSILRSFKIMYPF